MSTQGLVVNRWRRYGKDRLYVETADGSKVGFWDMLTDSGHPTTPEHLLALTSAVTDWKADQATGDLVAGTSSSAGADAQLAAVRTVAAPSDKSLAVSAEPDCAPMDELVRPWVDLADNRAGAEAREQALAARDAAPVKTVFARVLGVHTDERAWRIGADGEEKVAAQLAKVAAKDPRWRFLHAIPVGNRGSDIDHLVVGPGGIFTVNAKTHPKAKIWVGGNTFMVNGTKVPYVRNSRHEADRAAKLLTAACGFPVHVEGLIVTVNAEDVVVKSQPDGVSVTWRKNLTKWLLRHGDIYTTDTLDAIFEVARRSTTWR